MIVTSQTNIIEFIRKKDADILVFLFCKLVIIDIRIDCWAFIVSISLYSIFWLFLIEFVFMSEIFNPFINPIFWNNDCVTIELWPLISLVEHIKSQLFILLEAFTEQQLRKPLQIDIFDDPVSQKLLSQILFSNPALYLIDYWFLGFVRWYLGTLLRSYDQQIHLFTEYFIFWFDITPIFEVYWKEHALQLLLFSEKYHFLESLLEHLEVFYCRFILCKVRVERFHCFLY